MKDSAAVCVWLFAPTLFLLLLPAGCSDKKRATSPTKGGVPATLGHPASIRITPKQPKMTNPSVAVPPSNVKSEPFKEEELGAKQLVPPVNLWEPYGSLAALDIDGFIVAFGEVLESRLRCASLEYVPKKQTVVGIQHEINRLHQQMVAAGYKSESSRKSNNNCVNCIETAVFRKGRRYFRTIALDTKIDEMKIETLNNFMLRAAVLSYEVCVQVPRSDKGTIGQIKGMMKKRMAPFLRKWFGSNRYAGTLPKRVFYQEQLPCYDESQKMVSRSLTAEYDCSERYSTVRTSGRALSCAKASEHEYYNSYSTSAGQDVDWLFKIGRYFDDQWTVDWYFYPAPGSKRRSENQKMHSAELTAYWSKETEVPDFSPCPGP